MRSLGKWSSVAIMLVIAACAYVDIDLKLWQETDRVIEWDVHSYYAYLPAIFIYKDIELDDSDYSDGQGYYLFWPGELENGEKIIKTTMGVAWLYAPFFFLSHAYATISDHEANGWSPPYKIGLLIAALFYLTIGLLVIRKILERLGFNDITIALTILLLGTGTNLFFYSSHSGSMSHVFSFFLITLFIHKTIHWYERRSWSDTISIGLLIGLISLIRPTNALIIVFFALYGISSPAMIWRRVEMYWSRWPEILTMALLALLIWLPQLYYWNYITGSYLFNSYMGERFYFDRPKITEGLFGFRKGWFIYTPIMALATIGLVFLRKNLEHLRIAIVTFLVLLIYITFSWWCWWYGGSFGQRSMVDFYSLMSIPLAAFIGRIMLKPVLMIVAFPIMAFLIWLNVFQTYQYEVGAIHHDAMTFKAYIGTFGSMEPLTGSEPFLNYPDYEAAKKGIAR